MSEIERRAVLLRRASTSLVDIVTPRFASDSTKRTAANGDVLEPIILTPAWHLLLWQILAATGRGRMVRVAARATLCRRWCGDTPGTGRCIHRRRRRISGWLPQTWCDINRTSHYL